MLISGLSAIDFLPAHGNLTTPVLRDSIVSYHTFTDDQHWYGSESWAVKFDFRTFQTGIDSFAADGVMIYIPGSSSSDSLEVIVCNDYGSQPDLEDGIEFSTVIQAANINFNQWENIDFQNTITDSILWVVVNYHTNSTSQFIGASATSGLHSYYLYNGYYENMFASSFQSEFLFSIYGTFYIEDDYVDLDLVDFHWNGNLLTGENIWPVFTIRNTSDSQTATGAFINLNLAAPNGVINLQYFPSGAICPSIALPNILPQQVQTFDYTDEIGFTLLSIGSQYNFTTTIQCSLDIYPFNNSLSTKFEIFTDRQNSVLVENAVTIDNNSNNLLQMQSDLLENEVVEVINYYSSYTQTPFFCEDSYLRFNYYNLMGNPATMINGKRKIIGYIPSQYSVLFQDHYDDANVNDSTFISSDSMSGTYDQSGNIKIYYSLSNERNRVFASFLNNCSVYVGFVEDVINYGNLPADVNVPILRLIGGQSSAPTLQYGSTFNDTVRFNYLEDMELITGDVNNCRIVCWLQNNVTKRVYHVSSIPFSSLELVDIQENEIQTQSMQLNLFPNPFSFNGNMQISFSTKDPVQNSKLKIYNIRGQLVKELSTDEAASQHTFYWNGKDTGNKEVSSGIYLMKLITETAGKRSSLHKKCLLLKK